MPNQSITSYEYFQFVNESYERDRLGDTEEERVGRLVIWLTNEIYETFDEYQRALVLVNPSRPEGRKIPGYLRRHLASEFGDIEWFNFALAHENGIDPHQAHVLHAKIFGANLRTPKLSYFQNASMRHAENEKLTSKFGRDVSFVDNPFYHFARLPSAVLKGYDMMQRIPGPTSASDSEAPLSKIELFGRVSCTVAKASRYLIDMSLNEVIRLNMSKVESRRSAGQLFDHQPDSLH